MHKNRSLLIIACTLLIGASAWLFLSRPAYKNVILPNGTIVNAEIAATPLKQARGLMYRKHLDENSGMLFIFDEQLKHIFWMKNTLIPLDMIWLDSYLNVVGITYDAQPCKTKTCPRYMPALPATYVLEVNAGFAKQQSLEIGESLKLE